MDRKPEATPSCGKSPLKGRPVMDENMSRRKGRGSAEGPVSLHFPKYTARYAIKREKKTLELGNESHSAGQYVSGEVNAWLRKDRELIFPATGDMRKDARYGCFRIETA